MRSDVVKILLWTAVWGLCWLLVSSEVRAQTSVPGAPTIDTVEAGSSTSLITLAVTWTAPASDGGSAIESYDVRFIKTADDETDDANWTVEEKVWESGDGTLSTTISGLTDSTEYDVQVRAVNDQGEGAWSTTETGTTSGSWRQHLGGDEPHAGHPDGRRDRPWDRRGLLHIYADERDRHGHLDDRRSRYRGRTPKK